MGSDAINAAQERIAHLSATNQNTTDIAALQATVAAQTATINAQGAVIVEHQLLLDQLVTLLPPPPGNYYIELNVTTNHIAFPSGFSDVLDWTKSWSLGAEFYSLPNEAGDGSKASLFSSGGGHLTLTRQGASTGHKCKLGQL